jgi:predicted dehydrogenase
MTQIDGFEIGGYFTLDPESPESFGEEFGGRFHTSEADLLADDSLDAVAVFTPNDVHYEQVLRIAAHGKHIYVDKPMCQDVGEARAMIQAARAAGVILCSGHQKRRENRYGIIKSLMESGELGEVTMANVVSTSPAGLRPQGDGWKYDRSRTPAVGLTQVGVHEIDTLSALFGQALRVQAWLGGTSIPGVDDDICMARLEYDSGVCASLSCAYSVARCRSISVLGTGGSVYSHSETEVVYEPTVFGPSEGRKLDVTANDTSREQFEDFMRCCREGREPQTDGLAGGHAVAVLKSLIRSAQNGSRIEEVSALFDSVSI